MAKHSKTATLSEQLRRAIVDSGLSQYRIALDTDVAQAVLARFLAGERDIRLATADKLAAYLRLKLTQTK